jgi:TrmH family RNA methyltransferase
MSIIESASNSLVKTLAGLANARRRRDQRLFLVEGVRAVEDALSAGRYPQIALYDPDALARTERGSDLVRALRRNARHIPALHEATERAIAGASDTQHPQGVVAAFPFLHWELPAQQSGALALICDNVQDPGNLGTIMRTAEAAGVSALLLTPLSVDLYNPKVVRAAMGAHFRLPTFPGVEWSAIPALLESLRIPAERVHATEAGASMPYDRVDWTVPSALIVSNEAHGLSPEARRFAEGGGGFIGIPMEGGTESLNAAIAAAVVLFEAARQRRAVPGARVAG